MDYILHGYWRSSATYRVRIALNLKQIPYRYVPVHLVKEGGEQYSADYTALNPAQLVPTLINEAEDVMLNQSLSIIEYLDETVPDICPLIPSHRVERARVRALAQDIACDMQPIVNLRVLNALRDGFQANDDDVKRWAQKWVVKGFDSIEKRLQTQAGKFCFDFNVSLADVCLVPQVYNAKRFGVDMTMYPLISKIYDNCQALDAFQKAAPEAQSDAI
ncbi:maleylacetoacetate isomerase [Alteromonas sediminis]|uniref:Maleylacetoacetate isomerase n=1 Tax=Alteromonas sediminis TaxID=2259342 RepID=A0A3N5Z7Z9_9ALTE|nr:maleylacetoacetate isomerase [Alteromonas sediminis]RPJ65048.1 maleylacetoacetate isomerase [Alteromonas sediminis]